jgi:hypothetical protein
MQWILCLRRQILQSKTDVNRSLLLIYQGSNGSSTVSQNENSNPSTPNGNFDSPESKGNKTDNKSPNETGPSSASKNSQQKSDLTNSNDEYSPTQKGSSSPTLAGREKGNKPQLKLVMNNTTGKTDDFPNASQLSEKEVIGTPLKDANSRFSFLFKALQTKEERTNRREKSSSLKKREVPPLLQPQGLRKFPWKTFKNSLC